MGIKAEYREYLPQLMYRRLMMRNVQINLQHSKVASVNLGRLLTRKGHAVLIQEPSLLVVLTIGFLSDTFHHS